LENVSFVLVTLLALYTDGITEAYNSAEEQFGEQRFSKPCSVDREASSQRRLLRIVVCSASTRTSRTDDITLIILIIANIEALLRSFAATLKSSRFPASCFD